VADKTDKAPPHEFAREPARVDREELTEGASVHQDNACVPPNQWSLLHFEVVMALGLVSAMAVISWRQRLIRNLGT
jgi:uncharacterized membrane protein YcjF (UPF0283 family)